MSVTRVLLRKFNERRASRGYAHFTAANTVPAFWSPYEPVQPAPEAGVVVQLEPAEAPLIYVVDDLPCLTELYTLVLQSSGYEVRAFNDRRVALHALRASDKKPDLLITDYQGFWLPVERFMRECLRAHSALRILMASGLGQENVFFCDTPPTAFIQKPFTPQALQERVSAVLEGREGPVVECGENS
jgi:CheY-like chemotaxis protein